MLTFDCLNSSMYFRSRTRVKQWVFAAGVMLFPQKLHPNELFTFYLLPDTSRLHKQDQSAANLTPETTIVKYVFFSVSLWDPLLICLGRRFTCGKRSQRFFIYLVWRNDAQDRFQRRNRITSICFSLYFLSCFWIPDSWIRLLLLFLLLLLVGVVVVVVLLNIERTFSPFSRGFNQKSDEILKGLWNLWFARCYALKQTPSPPHSSSSCFMWCQWITTNPVVKV